MTFEVKEIGEDNEGKFAIISAKNDITGEIIEKKMYENKSYDSEKDFSDSAEEIGAGVAAGGTTYISKRKKRNKSEEN